MVVVLINLVASWQKESSMPNPEMINQEDEAASMADRRKFLAACGKFAVVTPPAITLPLSTFLNSTAIAQSGGRGDNDRGNNGWGNGGGDGSPNGKSDQGR
jgi:hypothetical protein